MVLRKTWSWSLVKETWPSVSTARPVCTARPSVSTARPVCTARPSVSTARPVYATRPIYPRMDNVRPRGSCSPIKRSYYTKPAFRPKDLKQDVKTFGVQNMTTAGTRAVVNTGKGKLDTDLKKSRWVWRPKGNYLDHVSKDSGSFMLKKGNPEILLQDHAVVDSGCSSHMTGNKAYLSDYEDFNGGFVAFGSDPKGVTENIVSFLLESECLILSPSFKLLDESQVVLRAPRKDDVYSLDLKNIVPSGGITCLYANATADESKLWIRRLESINKKRFWLVVTDDFSRFSWVFFFATKAETSKILCNLIMGFENQLSHNVKIIRCDNETEFKNYAMNELCAKKGIKREFSVARTLQQNGVAERKNRTLIEAARTMLADSLLPIPIWEEAVNTACYVNVDAGTQDSYVAGSSGKDKGPTQEYILLPLQPHRTRIPIEDVAPAAHEKPSKSSPKDNDIQDSEDEYCISKEASSAKQDNKLSTDRSSVSTDRPFVSTGRSSLSTVDIPYVSAASTFTGENAGESSFVFLGGKIPIDASTLPNADLPIDPNMPDLEETSNTLLNDGIFNGAYDDD
ncbi:putative ribonuclease H-like domain-containing protein [Tanacetum coccineum]|uniref:Ribonuclease H-like domain-containing protein n=1 Tax=Tanacetum coccineum TaxID=301880 RepID=A0ABQ5IID7_9ASTR